MRKNKRSKEYIAWVNMRDRCNNPNHKRYHDYGGRGIKVCERWASFEKFLIDMGYAPSPQHTLERIENEKGYYTENCKWATKQEQQLNTRQNHKITINGITKTITDWAKISGVNVRTLTARLKRGWPIEVALRIGHHRIFKSGRKPKESGEAGTQK